MFHRPRSMTRGLGLLVALAVPCLSCAGRRLSFANVSLLVWVATMQRVFVGFVLALLAVPAGAFGQANTLADDNPREKARMQLGPIYMTPRFALREFGIDTNVFNEDQSRKSDLTFTLTPALDAWLPMGHRGVIKATISSDLVYFQTYASERSVAYGTSVRAEGYAKRITVHTTAGMGFLRGRPNFEIDARTRRSTSAVQVGLDVALAPKVTFDTAFTRSTVGFDEDATFLGIGLRSVLDRQTRAVSGGLRFRATPLTSFALRAASSTTHFRYSPWRNSVDVEVMPGVIFKPGALITGSAFVGVRRSDLESSALPDFTGLVSDVSLAHTFRGVLQVGVDHARGLEYSFQPGQPYFIAHSFEVRVRRALGPVFDLEGQFQRHAYDYRGFLGGTGPGSLGPEAEAGRRDVTLIQGLSIGIRVGRTGRLAGGLEYQSRHSNLATGRDYNGLRVRTTVSHGF